MSSKQDHERAGEWLRSLPVAFGKNAPDRADAYRAGLVAGRAEVMLTWSNEPPTVVGPRVRYWWRQSPDNCDLDVIRAVSERSETKRKEYYPECQWAGPLPLPQEPQ